MGYFELFCALLFAYCTMLALYAAPCIARLLADGVSPPSGAIRNRRPIL